MTTKISQCRICRNPNLLSIIDLGNHALSSRFPRSDDPDPIESPLTLIKCDDTTNTCNCGLLQLSHNVSGDELYLQHYGYRSGLNNTMVKHLNNLTQEIETKIKLKEGDIALDIGSNDCTLLKSYSLNDKLKRVGIDPTGRQFSQYYPDSVTLIPTFFSADIYNETFPDEKAKVVTTISMFYDLPDPVAFAGDIKKILAPDGIWVTEQSYCITMLERNSFDTICHEHLEYYTMKQLKYIADKVGLQIIDVSLNECNGGSFRVTLAHTTNNKSLAVNDLLMLEEKIALHTLTPLNDFVARCETMKHELVSLLKEKVREGKSIYLYGASTKGNTLLQYYGLDNSIITAAAERNPEKYGRYTPRTKIPIISEKEMREQHPDFLLVLPWHFKEEFLEREKDYMDNGGSIIFPLPTLEIYPKKKALITGINGQIGSYLAELLLTKSYTVYGLIRRLPDNPIPGVKYRLCCFNDCNSMKEIIRQLVPDEIYNFAAQSDAVISLQQPELTMWINNNIVTALCEITKELGVKLFQASSIEIYKGINRDKIDESCKEFYPRNPYAIAKLAAHWTIRNYREQYKCYSVNGIIANAESPRRASKYVTRKITSGVKTTLIDPNFVLTLGNLSSERDWIHAADVATAAWLILQQDHPSDYMIGLGEKHTIRDFVESAFNKVGISLQWKGPRNSLDEVGIDEATGRVLVKIDNAFFRTYEAMLDVCGDNTRLRSIGWRAEYTLDDIIVELLQ